MSNLKIKEVAFRTVCFVIYEASTTDNHDVYFWMYKINMYLAMELMPWFLSKE
jgi:hypothetical protein